MSSFIQEEKGNPVVTLKAQAKECDFSMLRASKDNAETNSGHQAYKDINRMNFVIDNKIISRDLVTKLYKEYNSLLPKSEDESKDYCPFARAVFKKMFEYAEAEVPSDSILEELITNCNQSGYEFIYVPFMCKLFNEYGLHMDVNSSNVNRRVLIDCEKNSNSVRVECNASTIPVEVPGGGNRATCNISFSVGFTLESQDGKDGVTYKDGKLSLTVPRKLRDYKIDGRSLFDIIREYFYKFCEKLGFNFETEIEHDLDKPLEVNSCMKDPDVDSLNNKRGIDNN